MVLWNFPGKPQEDDSGTGYLNSPPTAGLIAGGAITGAALAGQRRDSRGIDGSGSIEPDPRGKFPTG